MADPADPNFWLNIASVIGAAIAAAVSALTRRSSKSSASGVEGIQTSITVMMKQLTDLVSRFDRHEGQIIARTDNLDREVAHLRVETVRLTQRTEEALVKLDAQGKEKVEANRVIWQAMDEVRRDLKRLELQAPKWGGE